MSNDQTTSEAPPRPQYKSYGEIVWGQFKKYPLSLWSLYGVGVLFVVAMIAPIIAMNIPFYISVPQGVGPEAVQGISFPWFVALFDKNFYETGVDIFFNVLLLTTPVGFLAWLGFKKFYTFEDKSHYRSMRRTFLLAVSLAILGVFLFAYFGGFRQPYVDYVALAEQDGVSAIFPLVEYAYRDTSAATGQDPSWAHWLGTDGVGRDVMTRLLFGTRISLTIGVVAVAIYVTIGMILGSLAGFFGGKIDTIILRLIEVMLCFPTFFLILTIRGFIEEPSIFHIMVIIGLTGWTKVARLVRGEFLRLKNEEFVQAAKAMGLKQGRIIFRHVLPNSLGPVLVSATFGVAGAILIEASLSFLGLGPPTAPSWGQILTTGRESQQMALILAPGIAIFITVSLLNLVGEGVRDAIDPKLRK